MTRPKTPLTLVLLCGLSHCSSFRLLQSASAPEMISISSLVICAWRRAVVVERQPVDHVAGVARRVVHRVILAPCSDAAFSRSARKIWTETLRGRRSARIGLLVRLVLVGGEPPPATSPSPRDLGRDQLLRRRDLRDHRLELGIEERRDVELALRRTARSTCWPIASASAKASLLDRREARRPR